MKITHVLTTLNMGGAERFVVDVSEKQIQLGHDVEVIIFGEGEQSLVQECQSRGVIVKRLTGNFIQRNKQFYDNVKHAEVIHIHSPYIIKSLFPSITVLTGIKIIYTRHGAMELPGTIWRLCHFLARQKIKDVTYVSEDSYIAFNKHHDWSDASHHVIENGVMLEDVNQNKSSSEKLRIGSVGRMVSLKNQISLIRAVSSLPKEIAMKVELHFFGDGECRELLIKECQNGLANSMYNFHGVQINRNLIYNNIDILAVTSETEGLSLAIIEAMAYEIPVLATNVGGNPRPVINGETGYLFEYEDYHKLAELIVGYIDNPKMLREHGKKAKKHIVNNFSLDVTLKRYQSLYV
jgi:glycosyltransferase involved in cell wall biosynthesis